MRVKGLLAEVLVRSDRDRAERELTGALPVFEENGSLREVERGRVLRSVLAVRPV